MWCSWQQSTHAFYTLSGQKLLAIYQSTWSCHCVRSVCSQHCNPSLRGLAGTHLCPLVLAPLRASEGELSQWVARHYSTAPKQSQTPAFSRSHTQCLCNQSVIELPEIPNTPGQMAELLSSPARSSRDKCCQGFKKKCPHSLVRRRHS